MLAAAALLIASPPAKAAEVFLFSFVSGPGAFAVGAFTTGAASPTDPGYDLVTSLLFEILSGTTESPEGSTSIFLTNLAASDFSPGAAFDPTTDAFLNHAEGKTFDDIGGFNLSDSVSIDASSFMQGSQELEGDVTGNGFSINGPLMITPVGGNVGTPPAATPLPATLPLFATGLGALGLLGWRRKRKASSLVAA